MSLVLTYVFCYFPYSSEKFLSLNLSGLWASEYLTFKFHSFYLLLFLRLQRTFSHCFSLEKRVRGDVCDHFSQTGKNVINLWHNTSSPSEEPATDFDCHLEIIESFLIPEALSKSSKLKKATYSIIHSSELPFQWTLWWISRFQNCNPVQIEV